jgi:hypothetical protein
MTTLDSLSSCPYCIDEFQPAGQHPILGPIFLVCLVCTPACPACHGQALFPAYGLFGGRRLHDALAKVGLFAAQCPTCGGVTGIAPINQEAHRHDH